MNIEQTLLAFRSPLDTIPKMRLTFCLVTLIVMGIAASLFPEGKKPLYLPPQESGEGYGIWLVWLRLYGVPLCLLTFRFAKSRWLPWAIRLWAGGLAVFSLTVLVQASSLGLRLESAAFVGVVCTVSIGALLYATIQPSKSTKAE